MPNREWKRKDCLVSVTDPAFELGDRVVDKNNPDGFSVTMKMIIRTNAPVSHWQGLILHELSGMKHKSKVHVDLGHDSSKSLGFLDKFDISNKEIVAHGQFISVAKGDATDIAVKQLEAGIPMEASIFFAGQGLKAEEFGDGTKFKVNGKSMVGPAIVFREWPLRGVALVAYGADNNTSTSLALAEEVVEVNFTRKESAMDEKEIKELQDKNAKLEVDLAAKMKADEDSVPTGPDFLEAFGDKGGKWFAEGKTFDESQLLFTSELVKENADMAKKLASIHRGADEDEVTGGQDDAGKDDAGKASLAAKKDKVKQLALRIGPRAAIFASGIVLPPRCKDAEPKDVKMSEVLKDCYMEMVYDVAERTRDDLNHKFASMTLLDIAIQNAADGAVGLIDETIEAHPELDVVPARTIKGINFKTLVMTTLPTVAFRLGAEGTAATKATYVNRLVETFILTPNWQVDQAIADRHEDGAAALIALEANAMMKAAMHHLAQQFYYGTVQAAIHATAGDTKGFNGLHSQIGASVANNILVDGKGTTGTNDCYSVFMIRTGPHDVQWVWGNNGSLSISPTRLERVTDSGGTNQYTAYYQEMLAYPGLQISSTQSIGRIGELNEHATDTTSRLTDEYLADLFSKFPVASKPTHIFMNRRAQKQLRKSRIWASGGTVVEKGLPVPFSFFWEGIPIHITDALLNTEADGFISA